MRLTIAELKLGLMKASPILAVKNRVEMFAEVAGHIS
jgi:hypothetical protein